MWEIDKAFTFEMAHRVWQQELPDASKSIDTICACRNIHGHSYTVKVFLKGDKLDGSGMVTDFKNLNFVKQFLDGVLDHKFMIDVFDPFFEMMTGMDRNVHFEDFTNLYDFVIRQGGIYTDKLREEYHKGFVLVHFCPTSENICKALFEVIKKELGDFAVLSAVELWETTKSHCRYTEE